MFVLRAMLAWEKSDILHFEYLAVAVEKTVFFLHKLNASISNRMEVEFNLLQRVTHFLGGHTPTYAGPVHTKPLQGRVCLHYIYQLIYLQMILGILY